MDATSYSDTDIIVFLNGKNEMIGYQLDMESDKNKKVFRLELPKDPPAGTEKILPLKGVRVKVAYHKDDLNDPLGDVVHYETVYSIRDDIKKNWYLARHIEEDKDMCYGYTPKDGILDWANWSCDKCANIIFCCSTVG